ncbi:Yip1 domain protein [uncultured archaeon]|nr:Yip1 domain protein [uncultured archaeon]
MVSLKEFVATAKERGLSKSEIISGLKEKGYSDKDIQEAFGYSQEKSKIKYSDEVKNFEKIKMLFFEPNGFFKKVREKTIINSLVTYVIISLIVAAISFGFRSILGGIVGGIFSSYLIGGQGVILSLILPILGIVSTFIYAGAAHIVIIILKGEGNFIDSYNAVTYSFVAGIILSIIPIVGFLGYIYSVVLMVFGLSEYHKISKGKAVAAAITPIIFVIVLLIILIFYFLVRIRLF